ncbi:MAG: ABC transporter permease [Paracoccaceae bacterium]
MSGFRFPIWRLALRDLAHEWRGTLVGVLGITVAIAPLLILFGLWFGVVETMRARLASDPANLELRHLPLASLSNVRFAEIRARPETGFAIPRTRYINLQVRMIHRGVDGARPVDAILTPTAEGDPLLAYAEIAAPIGERAVLSARAAETLRADPGDTVTLVLERRASSTGRVERVGLALTVAAVLPPGAETRARAFAPLPILMAIQDYQEWVRVERYGWPGDDPRADAWGGFRLYARSIDTVEPLRRWLVSQGYDVQSAADKIAFAERVNRDLGRLFAAILGLTVAGFAITVGLNQVANVARKRQVLAVLRLVGYGPGQLRWFPVVQAMALAFAGALIALLVYALMQPVIGALFQDLVPAEAGGLMRLPVDRAGIALLATVALAAVSSVAAARRAMRISPAETLRDG